MNRRLMFAILTLGLISLNAQSATVTREDLRKTVAHMQQLAHELQNDLDAAAAAKLALEVQLSRAGETLVDSQARVDALQAQIDQMAREQEAKLNAARASLQKAEDGKARAEADLGHVLGKYHFLKLLGASLLAALVFLLVWRFSPPVVGPWALGIYTIPPVAAFAAFFAIL